MSDLFLNLSECSVRVPFSHFVCAISVLLAWERILAIYRQQVVPVGVRTLVVAARTKVGEGNGWKKGSTDEKSITMLVYQSVLYMCSNM
ncbi:hypothetical protein E2C01_001154 [Portunus trituberculatus]|uniref:Uncharacterized protein n=1 Tax=Portunus trituberculatus TaxID=210409 RepID=A0A5B7CGH3_PORTR|nr:hypothetical protein [Portunus trituberculatus]